MYTVDIGRIFVTLCLLLSIAFCFYIVLRLFFEDNRERARRFLASLEEKEKQREKEEWRKRIERLKNDC